MKSSRRLWILVAVVALVAAACTSSDGGTTTTAGQGGGGGSESGSPVYDRVIANDKVRCGTRDDLPGFAFVDSDGNRAGFDVDFCKVVAAAVLGSADKAEFVDLATADRFTALQSGQIDVLIRNTTWTLTRDTEWTADYVATTFYDGQGIMVRRDLGVATIEDLAGASVCVTSGTTTELNLADAFRAANVPYTAVVFDEVDTVYNTYESGRCDAVTSDKSQLASRRVIMANPDDHVILDVTLSKEPLGPLTRHGDNQWNDIVNWVVQAVFNAEEAGVTSANVDTFKTDNPDVKRLLGEEGNLGALLGLDREWAKRVIKAVGNYAEIYERNIGPLGIPRGYNKLYTEGGLIYPYPFR